MREADKKRSSGDETRRDEVMEGPHGGHGGSLESEGGPQEQQPHAEPPIEHRPGQQPRPDDTEARDDTTRER